MKKNKLFTSVLLTITIMLSVITPAFAAIPEYGEEYANQPSKSYNVVFKDVGKSNWAFSYIMEMNERGVLAGYPNGYFYPDNTITRAEFSKVMCLAAGVTVSPVSYTSYVDVSENEWYAPYVEAGKYYLSGYVSDGKKYYMPDDNALREDIAVALVKLKGYDTSIYDESILKAMFKDWQSISSGARKYVAVAVENGLISGYEDNTFRGQNTITRAEAATLLWRAYQYGNGNKVFEKEEFETPVDTKPEKQPEKEPVIEKEEPEVMESEKDTVEEPEVEEPKEPEYLYEIKTIASGISSVDSMIATDDGIFYLSDYSVYEVSKDGNKAKLLVDKSTVPYLGTEEISKYDQSNLYTVVEYIGYDPYDDERYCIIKQHVNKYYLYNIDTKDSVDITDEFDKIHDDWYCSYPLSIAHKKFVINKFDNILIGDLTIDYLNDIIKTSIGTYSEVSMIVNNNRYMGGKNRLNIFNSKTESAEEKFDYYIDETNFLFGNNKSHFYFNSKDKVYRVDTNGDSKILCTIEDIDNVDERAVNISNIKIETAAVSDDEIIYFWDVNYNCIRQISHI